MVDKIYDMAFSLFNVGAGLFLLACSAAACIFVVVLVLAVICMVVDSIEQTFDISLSPFDLWRKIKGDKK